jgi:hypothetical protein
MILRLLLLAFTVAGAACSSTLTRRVGADGQLPPMVVSVRHLPGSPVKVPRDFQVYGRMNSQGLVDIQLPVANRGSRSVRFRYSWQWIGPDGFSTTDPAREVWRTGFLEGRDATRIGSTSTVAAPSGVVLRLSNSP